MTPTANADARRAILLVILIAAVWVGSSRWLMGLGWEIAVPIGLLAAWAQVCLNGMWRRMRDGRDGDGEC